MSVKGKGQRSTSGPRAGLDQDRAEKQQEVKRVNRHARRDITVFFFLRETDAVKEKQVEHDFKNDTIKTFLRMKRTGKQMF